MTDSAEARDALREKFVTHAAKSLGPASTRAMGKGLYREEVEALADHWMPFVEQCIVAAGYVTAADAEHDDETRRKTIEDIATWLDHIDWGGSHEWADATASDVPAYIRKFYDPRRLVESRRSPTGRGMKSAFGMDIAKGPDRIPIAGTRYFAMSPIKAMVARETSGSPHHATIEFVFSEGLSDWWILSFGVEASGMPITTESMRDIGVAQTLSAVTHNVLDIVGDAAGTPWDEVWRQELEINAQLRANGPDAANLATVAEMYHVARVMRFPIVQMIATTFEMSVRTASHWIKLAKERGVLVVPQPAPVV